jgi:hypothetical protein
MRQDEKNNDTEISDELEAELTAKLIGVSMSEDKIERYINYELHAFDGCDIIKRVVKEVLNRLSGDVVDNLTKPDFPVIIITTSSEAFIRTWLTGKDFTFKEGFRLLCINKDLECEDISIVKGIVAHELAHLYLGHNRLDNKSDYRQQQYDADAEACKWGFEDEIVKGLNAEVMEAREAEQRLEKIKQLKM